MKLILTLLLLLFVLTAESQITRLWLTHKADRPSHMVINWYSSQPGNSEVYYRTTGGREIRVSRVNHINLHHVEIPLEKSGTEYHYRVKTGEEESSVYTFRSYPSTGEPLRIALVGNWGYAENPDLSHLIADRPDMLISLGDNIPDLHQLCGEGAIDCVEPFLRLIDSQPDLFRSVPFMPILGNHDREIRPRGQKYPPVAVYDTNAVAFRRFFELPGEEWRWEFSIPAFDVTFLALDLNHITDFGTTWQTGRGYSPASDQFRWYQSRMKELKKGHIITLLNEQNMRMRKQEGWQNLFESGTMVFSGFGYYSERADVEGFPYFNTSLKAGDLYPDEFSQVLKGKAGYILLTLQKDKPVTVEMKSLAGEVLDTVFVNAK